MEPWLQVQEFWHDLEVSTNQKHAELVQVINAHLDRLARDIEDVVRIASSCALVV